MADNLTLDRLERAVKGTAAAFRCRTELQPAGGEGDKVFPPTYAGAVYATERRRLPGREEPVECVLLDSVQSQANRMEEALQQAIDEGQLCIPVIEVDFTDGDLLTEVGKVTSLQAPHRIADAILRDSLLGDLPFRKSEEGKRLDSVSLLNATALFELCPTALIFGMWDSTGPKGGAGAKFARAMVSEIVGIDAVYGVKTASRVDPILHNNPKLYETSSGEMTPEESEAAQDSKGRPKPYGKKLSELNLGNVTPDVTRYLQKQITSENRETIDPMRKDGEYVSSGRVAPGGVTVASAEQMIVLSLPALRRLKFPLDGAQPTKEVNEAGRTVLAALGLCAAVLAAEKGFDLRSRCLLWPADPPAWELLDKPGAEPDQVVLDSEKAIELLDNAVAAAEKVGLMWRKEPLALKPSPQLVALVKRSQELAAQQTGDAEGSD